MQVAKHAHPAKPCHAFLAFADGRIFQGQGFGREGVAVGELVFNTAMTGYQEILSDPSYAGQMITFTSPHIGNTGVNDEDVEAQTIAARGAVVRALSPISSNWRQKTTLALWCEQQGIVGISGVDTRRIAQILRDEGAQNAAIGFSKERSIDLKELVQQALDFAGLDGQDLVPGVGQPEKWAWQQGEWTASDGYQQGLADGPHIAVIDYGVKHNILRILASMGCRISVVPASMPGDEILAIAPDGIVLSNGPGDPAATGQYAVPVIQRLVDSGKPLMGICLGHQMLGLALGARTQKMAFGHHGANHPVQDLRSGQVEITSQNHGFAISDEDLPAAIEVTHRSLFDGTIQGIALRDRPVYSIQYHPEASPGPMDSRALFERFLNSIAKV